MAHRNRWFTVLKNGGSFHGYVSHNQMVIMATLANMGHVGSNHRTVQLEAGGKPWDIGKVRNSKKIDYVHRVDMLKMIRSATWPVDACGLRTWTPVDSGPGRALKGWTLTMDSIGLAMTKAITICWFHLQVVVCSIVGHEGLIPGECFWFMYPDTCCFFWCKPFANHASCEQWSLTSIIPKPTGRIWEAIQLGEVFIQNLLSSYEWGNKHSLPSGKLT